MKRSIFVYALSASSFLGLQTAPVVAYELATHGQLTYQALNRSVLTNSQFLQTLGITNGKNPFGEVYYDVFGTEVTERKQNEFEKGKMPQNTEPLSVEGWLLRGAIREDDYASAFGFWVAPNPQGDSDPPQAFWRMMNHFYDPVNDRSLTLSTTLAGLFTSATGESAVFRAAPNWAVGSPDVFRQPNDPEAGRRNHFTVFDAREALYRALTGKKKDGTDIDPSGQPATKQERDKYWATTFRALGDVVHLVQDMAQPQHTRNDHYAATLRERSYA